MLPYLDAETFTYALTDLRGYGRSMSLEGQYTAHEAASDALALADHLGWERFHLIGYSMTGMVVERMAIDAEERIESIVAIGPVSAAGVEVTAQERQFLLDTITNDDQCRQFADRITGNRLSYQWQEVKLRLARETRTPEAARGYLDMWTRANFSDEAGSNLPLLVIACRYDQPKLHQEYLERTFLSWHPRAEFTTIDCGHCPMQEMPIYLQTVMEEFMKRYLS